MQLEITVQSISARQVLANTPARIDRALRAAMNDATAYIHRQTSTYPPQRTGSSYRRTDTLKRSWSREVRAEGREIVGTVGSNGDLAPYNRLVQDGTRQARVHRGRWATVQAIRQRSEGPIQEMFSNRIRAALG